MVGAIAGGLLKASPALAKRLAAAEEELARLQAAQQVRAPVIARIAPRSGERFERMAGDLELHMQRDPDRSRAALIEAIGPQIVLRPDESRKFLWAEYGLEEQRLVAAVGMPEIMVAGAGFGLSLQFRSHSALNDAERPTRSLGVQCQAFFPTNGSAFAWHCTPRERVAKS